MERKYKVEIIVEIDGDKTQAQGLQEAREFVEKLCLKVVDVKPLLITRSIQQNRSLHLWFTQISDEANEKGLTMDMIVKNPAELPITSFLLKDLFRFIGKKSFHKDSTAKLNKEEFNQIQRTFERIIAERLEISIPFPNYELM